MNSPHGEVDRGCAWPRLSRVESPRSPRARVAVRERLLLRAKPRADHSVERARADAPVPLVGTDDDELPGRQRGVRPRLGAPQGRERRLGRYRSGHPDAPLVRGESRAEEGDEHLEELVRRAVEMKEMRPPLRGAHAPRRGRRSRPHVRLRSWRVLGAGTPMTSTSGSVSPRRPNAGAEDAAS